MYKYLPTPPHEHCVKQSQFFKWSSTGLIQSFHSPKLVAIPSFKNLICPASYLKGESLGTFISQ